MALTSSCANGPSSKVLTCHRTHHPDDTAPACGSRLMPAISCLSCHTLIAVIGSYRSLLLCTVIGIAVLLLLSKLLLKGFLGVDPLTRTGWVSSSSSILVRSSDYNIGIWACRATFVGWFSLSSSTEPRGNPFCFLFGSPRPWGIHTLSLRAQRVY